MAWPRNGSLLVIEDFAAPSRAGAVGTILMLIFSFCLTT
jgi:hypothetical protein